MGSVYEREEPSFDDEDLVDLTGVATSCASGSGASSSAAAAATEPKPLAKQKGSSAKPAFKVWSGASKIGKGKKSPAEKGAGITGGYFDEAFHNESGPEPGPGAPGPGPRRRLASGKLAAAGWTVPRASFGW